MCIKTHTSCMVSNIQQCITSHRENTTAIWKTDFGQFYAKTCITIYIIIYFLSNTTNSVVTNNMR